MDYSVVIPAYNAESTLDKTLASIARQTMPVAEVILVNDGSTDGTRAIAERWGKRLPIKIVDQPINLGLTQALIDGVRECKCEWILRIDSDDFWDRNHVQTIDEIDRNSDVVLVSTQTRMFDNEGRPVGVTAAPNPKFIRVEFMYGNRMCHSSVAFSKQAYHKAGGYRHFVKWEDYDLWIRLLTVGNYQTVDKITVNYLVRPDSIYHSTNLCARKLADIACNKFAIKLFWKQHPLQAIKRIFILGVYYLS